MIKSHLVRFKYLLNEQNLLTSDFQIIQTFFNVLNLLSEELKGIKTNLHTEFGQKTSY